MMLSLKYCLQGHSLFTIFYAVQCIWINFNPNMDKEWLSKLSVGWNYLTIPEVVMKSE